MRNLGLIGAGYWGKNLARNFYELGALHTLCDSSAEHLETYQKTYPDICLAQDYQTLLNNPEITCIAIAAPAIQHYQIAKACLEAGKDVYVEKPIALKSQEAKELVELADQKQKVLMVGHLLHYHPCFVKLLEMVKAGELGTIYSIISNRTNLGPFRREENALWNFAPHDISMVLGLAGDQIPTKMRCTGGDFVHAGIADSALATLEFPNGIKSHIFVSWLHPYKEQKVVVIGSKAMAVFDDTLPWEEKLVLVCNPIIELEEGVFAANANERKTVVVERKEPLKEECLHFIDACRERSIPKTCGREGLRVTEVLEALDESLKSGGEIMVSKEALLQA